MNFHSHKFSFLFSKRKKFEIVPPLGCSLINCNPLGTLMYLLQLLQGTKAFCSGGDQALRSKDGYADYENFGRLNVLDLQVNNSLCLNLWYGFEAKYTRKSFAHALLS